MKKILILIIVLTTLNATANAKEYKVYGPQGGLAMEVTLPKGFNAETDKCPMVILMHGIFSSKNIVPIPALAKELARNGIASICFDFGGHWKADSWKQGHHRSIVMQRKIRGVLHPGSGTVHSRRRKSHDNPKIEDRGFSSSFIPKDTSAMIRRRYLLSL